MRRGLIVLIATGACAWAWPAGAAENSEGKTLAQAQCVQCHEADDWDGEDAASLESLIKDIVDGKVKHKTRIGLTPAQISAIAQYWAQSSGKR